MESVMERSIWLGRDRREQNGFDVGLRSLLRHLGDAISVHPVDLQSLQLRGLYKRPTEVLDGVLIDVNSMRPDFNGAMATDHAIARFFVPHLARHRGWALFMDGSDMLVRSDIARVFHDLDPAKALYCVQHDHVPANTVKMDGRQQTIYPRKNWSSFMIFNCEHPANRVLTLDALNTKPGRDLHGFCWLDDCQIGALPLSWNFLVGHTDPALVPNVDVAHFTDGTPDMKGYEAVAYADEWRAELQRCRARAPALV